MAEWCHLTVLEAVVGDQITEFREKGAAGWDEATDVACLAATLAAQAVMVQALKIQTRLLGLKTTRGGRLPSPPPLPHTHTPTHPHSCTPEGGA